MNKKVLLIFVSALSLVGCVSEFEKNTGNEEINQQKNEIADNLASTVDYVVPIVDGYISTVSYNGILLARTSTPFTIKVPKSTSSRSSNEINVTYSEGRASAPFWNLWQTILFEDSKKGDYDYNDIVIHANYQMTGKRLSVKIHPIALGSKKDIKLGFSYRQGNGELKDVIVAENCRNDLFGGRQGFINTNKYDIHIDDFVKSVDIELNSDNQAVDISWFIIVDKDLRINSVNQDKKECLDDNFMPFGFALTNVGHNGVEKRSISNEDLAAWNKRKPDVSSWASMPAAAPSVPAEATDLATEKTPWNLPAKSYFIEGNPTFNQLEFQSGAKVYVKNGATFNIINYHSNYTIYVLPGGKLVMPVGKTYQNIKIYNYGTLEMKGEGLKSFTLDYNSELYTNSGIENNNIDLLIQSNAKLYVQGDVNVWRVYLNGNTSKVYCNSVNTQYVEQTNSSLLYINGSLKSKSYTSDSYSVCYVDCAMIITDNISITNSINLYVKGYINSPHINTSSYPKIYLCAGGMLEAKYLTFDNFYYTQIEVIGSDLGLVNVERLTVNGLNGTNTLLGNIGLIAKDVVYGNSWKKVSDLTLGRNVVTNEKDISIPSTPCSPGYNEITVKDDGAAWFSYPMENESINNCYDISSWKKGTYNFSPLNGAKIFDINNTAPGYGKKMKIYQIE